MKAKFLTLAFFAMMTVSFFSCTQEEVAPAMNSDMSSLEYCECEGGQDDREPRQ
jgi:hypothetical protein